MRKLFITMFWLSINISFGQNKIQNDSIITNLNFKVEKINVEVIELKKLQNNQQEFTNLTNERIKDNLSQLDRLSSSTTTGISVYAIILAILNVFLFLWIFLVSRDLKTETKELNKETKKSNEEFDEKLNRKSEELTVKTDALYTNLLNSKFGRHDKKLMNEILNNDKDQKFEDLKDFHTKIVRAEKELEDNDIRSAINHFTDLLKENKERDFIYNKIGIAYYKLGASKKALEFFEKAYNETEEHKGKYILNLISQYMILELLDDAKKLLKKCESYNIDLESKCIFLILKFIFFVKTNNIIKLKGLKKEQDELDWNQESNWEFVNFRDCFKDEYANDFSEIFRFSNIIYSPIQVTETIN